MSATEGAAPLLQVEHLTTVVEGKRSTITIVDDVSWQLRPGEVLGVVGESGSGKSMSVLSLIGLLPRSVRVTQGTAMLGGADLLSMAESELRRVRGKDVGFVFQDPMTSFNPVRTIGSQIGEAIKVHDRTGTAQQRRGRVLDLLTCVGVPNPVMRASQYPHEFSGGMRQRAMIAMAIANSPQVLIADEPTTALDVTTQAQILDLLRALHATSAAATVFITHDLGVVGQLCDRVLVMYAGRVVESGPVARVLTDPAHPYTQGLLSARPRIAAGRARLRAIGGQPPDMAQLGEGCAFRERCVRGRHSAVCAASVPELLPVEPGHDAACHHVDTAAACQLSGGDDG